MDRRRKRPETLSLLASAGVHAIAVLVAWWSQLYVPPQIEYIAYEIEMVSPPPLEESEEILPPPPRDVVETPEPETPPPDEEAVPDPEEPEPEPEPERTNTEPRDESEETPEEVSAEEINVRMEGLRRDFPAYYQNIIYQINRCFRWRGVANLETHVGFVILEDGTVDGLRFVRESGDMEFDIAAMGAVECASGRFGALPEELPFDRIPIIFFFRPAGRDGEPTQVLDLPVQAEERRWGEQASPGGIT